MSLPAGHRIGPYEVVALRGKGGMGEVYRARDQRLERDVAIKTLPAELSRDDHFRQRLARESKAISQLSHPHVCTLYDVVREDGLDFLVMEYLEGETLEERLRRGPLRLDEALRIGGQIASALDAAHQRHLVHRDLKPSNVMLTRSGAKVLDFGIAKRSPSAEAPAGTLAPTATRPLTGEGAFVGTLHYMSPEQLEGKEADARSDVFALGAVLYEMVSGERAFQADSTAGLILAILRSTPDPPSRKQPLAPQRLDWLVARCLEKDPDRRWRAAHDVSLELEAIAGVPAPSRESGSAPAVGRGRPARLVTASASAGLLAGLVLAALVLAPNRGAWPFRGFAPATDATSWTVAELDLPLPQSYRGRVLALSPDGRMVAFLGEKAGQRQIFLRSLDSLEVSAVAGTEGVEFLGGFSPDSETLTFSHSTELRSVPIAGGAASTLVPDTFSGRFADDGFLYFTRLVNAGTRAGTELWRKPVAGGAQELVGQGHVSGGPIPGTRLLLTYAPAVRDEPGFWSDVELLDVGTGKSSVLDAGARPYFVAPGFVVFYRDGTLWAAPFDPRRGELEAMPRPVETGVRAEVWRGHDFGAFDVNEKGDLLYRSAGAERLAALVWVDRTGNVLGEAAPERRSFEVPALSPDGRTLLATVRGANATTERWWLDLGTGAWTRPAQVGSRSSGERWISGGRETVFESNHGGYLRAYVQATDPDAKPTPLIDIEEEHVALDFSPDGRHVLFNTLARRGLSVYDRELREVRQLDPRHSFSASFHPSGRFIAYATAADPDHPTSEVWVQPFPGPAEPRQISRDGAQEVLWSRDGRELYFRSPTHVVAVPVTVTGDRLHTGRPVPLFEDRFLHGEVNGITNYDVHPDGRFLMLHLAGAADDGKIVLVQNWVAKLREVFAEED